MPGLNVAELRTALETQLGLVAGIPASTHWVRENVVPNDDETEEAVGAAEPFIQLLLGFDDGDRRERPASLSRIWHSGTWNLWLHYPINRGAGDADTAAAAIVAAFPDGQGFTSGTTTVRIMKVGRRAGFQHKGEWVVRVNVRWEVITANTF